MVQHDQKRMDLIFDSSAFLANLLTKYSRLESFCQNPMLEDNCDGKNLEDSIIEVYASILRYIIEVKSSLVESKLRMMPNTMLRIPTPADPNLERVLKAFLAFTGQPLDILKEDIENQEKDTRDWVTRAENECMYTLYIPDYMLFRTC